MKALSNRTAHFAGSVAMKMSYDKLRRLISPFSASAYAIAHFSFFRRIPAVISSIHKRKRPCRSEKIRQGRC